MTLEALRFVLMDYMKKTGRIGRKNAVDRDEVLFHLQASDPALDDRRFRYVYAGDHKKNSDRGAGVCTCSDGLFIPATPAEVEEFYRYIFKQSGPIVAARRRDNVLHWHPTLRPEYGKQQELGI